MAKFPFKNVLEGTKHFWTKSQGPDAEGAAVTANPLTIGYKNASGNATGVTPTEALPVGDAAAQAKLADILTKLSADPATQTTLAQILAKIIAAPATEAKQDTIISHVDGVEGTLTALSGKDFATQTTLAAILNKIIAAPATEAKQTALNALIGEVQAAPTANTLLARLKNLETKVDAIIADGIKLSGSNATILEQVYSRSIPYTFLTTTRVHGVTSGDPAFTSIDVSKYSEIIVKVKNTLDVGVVLSHWIYVPAGSVTDKSNEGFMTAVDVSVRSVAVGAVAFYRSDVASCSNFNLKMPGFGIYISGCACTTGNLTITVYGKK